MNRTKQAFLKSVLALLLCISMLIGSTFAWFTDSVSSAQNIIQSGNLDLEMYWSTSPTGPWNDVEDPLYNTVFDYDNWEPGYTDVKYIKLVNSGSLALKYDLTITPDSEVGKLAEVIQVYFDREGGVVSGRADLAGMGSLGSLKTVLGGGAVMSGTILPNGKNHPTLPIGETVFTLAMSMITTAGNDYQLETAGEFSITALATQVPYEEDSFGTNYDVDAAMPVILRAGSATASVSVTDDVITAPVTMTGDSLTAHIPAGVKLEAGVTQLKLNVTPLQKTTSGIVAVGNELLLPMDIHIDGIADDNVTPIVIDLGPVWPQNMNVGNYHFTHVEDGVNQPMTLVDDAAALTAHNTFTYDPLTGNVTIAVASFSEFVAVADRTAPWGGDIADNFAGGSGTKYYPYLIANADQLAYLGELVSSGTDTTDKYYALATDLNFGGASNTDNGKIFYPIGYHKKGEGQIDGYDWYTYGGAFSGTFDGRGHTVTGIYQNTWAMRGDYDGHYYNDAMGLFGYVKDGTVKNLTVDNFYSEGEFAVTGCVTAYAGGTANFEGIAVTNSHPQTYNTGVACIVGYDGKDGSTFNFTNITVDATNTVSALWGSYDVGVAGILGALRENSYANFNKCNVTATMDAYNDVCGNYQYYWYRYTGAFIGTVRRSNGNKCDLANVTATNCTANLGYPDSDPRHEYYYCEMVENTQASYTHDYQMSRLTLVKSVDVENKTYTTLAGETKAIPTAGRQNFVVRTEGTETTPSTENATCYHFVDGVERPHKSKGYEKEIDEDNDGNPDLIEDKQHIYLPYRQLFGGYGWGVNGIDLDEYVDKNGVPIIQIIDYTDAKDKFVSKVDSTDGSTYTIYKSKNTPANRHFLDSLFAQKSDVTINKPGVWVTIENIDKTETTAGGTFYRNEEAWSRSYIDFRGTGRVRLTIQDYDMCRPLSIEVRVVDIEAPNPTLVWENRFDNPTDNNWGIAYSAKDSKTGGAQNACLYDGSKLGNTNYNGNYAVPVTDGHDGYMEIGIPNYKGGNMLAGFRLVHQGATTKNLGVDKYGTANSYTGSSYHKGFFFTQTGTYAIKLDYAVGSTGVYADSSVQICVSSTYSDSPWGNSSGVNTSGGLLGGSTVHVITTADKSDLNAWSSATLQFDVPEAEKNKALHIFVRKNSGSGLTGWEVLIDNVEVYYMGTPENNAANYSTVTVLRAQYDGTGAVTVGDTLGTVCGAANSPLPTAPAVLNGENYVSGANAYYSDVACTKRVYNFPNALTSTLYVRSVKMWDNSFTDTGSWCKNYESGEFGYLYNSNHTAENTAEGTAQNYALHEVTNSPKQNDGRMILGFGNSNSSNRVSGFRLFHKEETVKNDALYTYSSAGVYEWGSCDKGFFLPKDGTYTVKLSYTTTKEGTAATEPQLDLCVAVGYVDWNNHVGLDGSGNIKIGNTTIAAQKITSIDVSKDMDVWTHNVTATFTVDSSLLSNINNYDKEGPVINLLVKRAAGDTKSDLTGWEIAIDDVEIYAN